MASMLICVKTDLILKIINVLFCLFGAFVVLYFLYQYMKRRGTTDAIHDKALHYMILLLFLLILITYIIMGLAAAFQCFDANIYYILKSSVYVMYVLQYPSLIWILFYRLCVVFRNTSFRVSNNVKAVFYVTYSVGVAVAFINLYSLMSNMHRTMWHPVITTLGVFTAMAVIITLVALYMHKLMMTISKQQGDNYDAKLVSVVTKTFILTLVCIATFIVVGVVMSIQTLIHHPVHSTFVLSLFTVLDLGTNFLSILFGLKMFENHYIKICGCCHSKGIGYVAKKMTVNEHPQPRNATLAVADMTKNQTVTVVESD